MECPLLPLGNARRDMSRRVQTRLIKTCQGPSRPVKTCPDKTVQVKTSHRPNLSRQGETPLVKARRLKSRLISPPKQDRYTTRERELLRYDLVGSEQYLAAVLAAKTAHLCRDSVEARQTRHEILRPAKPQKPTHDDDKDRKAAIVRY